MARLQAAGRGRLLVMILLALFLLAVAPAQAARFTSNYLPVVVSCFHIYVFLHSLHAHWRSERRPCGT
jgi:hypothetical protein